MFDVIILLDSGSMVLDVIMEDSSMNTSWTGTCFGDGDHHDKGHILSHINIIICDILFSYDIVRSYINCAAPINILLSSFGRPAKVECHLLSSSNRVYVI